MSLADFKVLPLRFSNTSTGYHELYIKEHSVKQHDENKPPGRTLFVINVPPYATEASLSRVFSAAGNVKLVTLQKLSLEQNNGFQVAYIVFEKQTGLTKALKLNSLEPLSTKEFPVVIGLQKWVEEYNSTVYDHQQLEDEVNSFIANYDREQEKKKLNEETVDDEGWTVVTKKGRNPGVSRKESVGNKIIQKNKERAKKRELKNFYTFQLKEEKMKNIVSLRKSFQESKEKVNAMKKLRNFKPL